MKVVANRTDAGVTLCLRPKLQNPAVSVSRDPKPGAEIFGILVPAFLIRPRLAPRRPVNFKKSGTVRLCGICQSTNTAMHTAHAS